MFSKHKHARFPSTRVTYRKENIIVTCPLLMVIGMLMVGQSQTSCLDNELGLAASYHSNQGGRQRNVEYHLGRERLIIH